MNSATVPDLQAWNGNCKHPLASSPFLLVQWESTELLKPIVVSLSPPLLLSISLNLLAFSRSLSYFLFLSVFLHLSSPLSSSLVLSISLILVLVFFSLSYCLSLALSIYITQLTTISV